MINLSSPTTMSSDLIIHLENSNGFYVACEVANRFNRCYYTTLYKQSSHHDPNTEASPESHDAKTASTSYKSVLYVFIALFSIKIVDHLTSKPAQCQKYYRQSKHTFACKVAVLMRKSSCKVLTKTAMIRNV